MVKTHPEFFGYTFSLPIFFFSMIFLYNPFRNNKLVAMNLILVLDSKRQDKFKGIKAGD